MKTLLLLLLSIPALGQTPGPKDSVWNATIPGDCGLVSRFSSAKISPQCYTQALNVLLDEDSTVLRRGGQAKYNSTPCTDSKTIRGMWPFTDTNGNRYLVILSSKSIFQTSGQGDCTVIPLLSGIANETQNMNCVQTIGRLWCTNGSDGVFSWDGTSTGTISGAPLGKYIGAFRNRLILAGISGQQTRIRGSSELDGTDWTLQIPGRSTTPFSIDIAGTNDGLPITCLLGEYQNSFIVGRDRDLWALSGYDRRDFTLRKISSEIGCIEQQSVQEKNNALYWLSRRGIEKMTGTQISRASDNIRPVVDNIIQSAPNSFLQSKLFSTQSDWQEGFPSVSGSSSPVSTTISPGNIVPSSWTHVDSSTADWSAWTFVDVDSVSWVGKMTLSRSATSTYIRDDFESYSDNSCSSDIGGDWLAYSTSSGNNYWNVTTEGGHKKVYNCGNDSPNYKYFISTITHGRFDVQLGCRSGVSCNWTGEQFSLIFLCKSDMTEYYKISILGGVGGVAAASLIFYSSATNTTLDGSAGVTIPSDGTASTFSLIATATGSLKVLQDGALILQAMSTGTLPSGRIMLGMGYDAEASNLFDSVSLPAYLSSGTITSQIYDTAFSTPTYGVMSSTFLYTRDGQSVAFYTRTSAVDNGTGFTGWQASSDTLRIGPDGRRYIQAKVDMATTLSTMTPEISSLELSAGTTGYYITNCATTSAISSWGLFRTNYQNKDGSFTFWVSTGPTCNAVTRSSANWTSQTANSNISIDTSAFIAARVLFDLDSATETPTLNDVLFEWNSGTSRPPLASAVYRDRYLMFYTSSTETTAHNDHVLVLDSGDKWLEWDGINAYSAAIYTNKLYTGSSSNDGTIYLQDTGTDDAGSDFTMRIKTPDMDMGNPTQRKIFKRLYVDLSGPAINTQDIDISVSYNIDGSTTSYSLSAANLNEAQEQSAYFTAKFPFPIDQKNDGHWISLTLGYTGSAGPVRVYGLRLVWEGLDWP